MNFSASQLVKHSSKQLIYFIKKGLSPTVTPQIIAGYASQFDVSTSPFVEMSGHIQYLGHNLYFSIDEIRDNLLIEHKYVGSSSSIDRKYFNTYLLQTALYSRLANLVPVFKTAKFHVNNGNPSLTCPRPYKAKTILQFSGDYPSAYHVTATDHVLEHYLAKLAVVASLDYEKATEWDSKYKDKEFDQLLQYIQFNKIP